MTGPVVLLDACVLVPYPLVSALLTMAERELFVPRWSEHILDEVERTLIGKLDLDPDKVKHRLDHMRAGFPESSVHGYKDLIEEMTCDGKDRHVLAAAVAAGADLLVTANIKDFPKSSYEQYGIEVIHPEVLLSRLFNHDEEGCIEALHADAGRRRNPPLTTEQLLAQLAGLAPTFANNVHQRISVGVRDGRCSIVGVDCACTGHEARWGLPGGIRRRLRSNCEYCPPDAARGPDTHTSLSAVGHRVADASDSLGTCRGLDGGLLGSLGRHDAPGFRFRRHSPDRPLPPAILGRSWS